MTDDFDISIGGVGASQETVNRLSMLVWAPAGMGKTTLGMTMPGRKALINFDPDGPASLAPEVLKMENDSRVFDLSGKEDSFFARLKDHDPFGLEKVIDQFDSYIFDSITSVTERTLARGIDVTKGATLERPSPGAYMARNNLAINMIRNILQITGKHNKHVLFIAHEGAPQTNDEGSLIGYTMSLGGQLPSQAALRINECWPMFETGRNEKMIICRKSRLRDPAKSRMFDTTTRTEFEWKFNPNKWDDPNNMRIDKWFEQWKASGYAKLQLPK
jgi:hypothetical protein